MSLISTIEKQASESNEFLQVHKNAFMDVITNLTNEYKLSTNANIEKDFGDFLYKVLGNVNSTGKKIDIPNATKFGFSFWERKKIRDHGPGGVSRHIIKAAVNNMFGFIMQGQSYIQPINHIDLLSTLTKYHVDLIISPKKRKIVNDFYMFKQAYYNNYYNMVKELDGNIIQLSIPVILGNIYNVNALKGNYKVLDGVFDGEVTAMSIELSKKTYMHEDRIHAYNKPNIHNWSYLFKNNCWLTLNFQGINKATNQLIKLSSIMLNFNNNDELTNDAYIHNTSTNEYVQIVDMATIFKDKKVLDIIYKVINFNKIASKALDHLRMKYAKQLILNGTF